MPWSNFDQTRTKKTMLHNLIKTALLSSHFERNNRNANNTSYKRMYFVNKTQPTVACCWAVCSMLIKFRKIRRICSVKSSICADCAARNCDLCHYCDWRCNIMHVNSVTCHRQNAFFRLWYDVHMQHHIIIWFFDIFDVGSLWTQSDCVKR